MEENKAKMEENKIAKRRLCEIPGVRYLFAINGLLGFTVVYALRMSINVAIVAMVNNTAIYKPDNDSTSDECAVDDRLFGDNSTAADSQPDGEFIWTTQTQGVILGAFYYGYCISQIPGGRLAEIYSGKWVFAAGVLITAILTLLTPLAARYHLGFLITIRVLEGLAQGMTFPAMRFLIARWSPDSEKGLINAIAMSGINIGTVVSMPLVGFLCESDLFGGWPSAFYVIGMFSCCWFLLWCIFITDTPLTHPFISRKEIKYITSNQKMNLKEKLPPIPWKRILTSVPFWALVITHTLQDWSFYTLVTDLPTFFTTMLHFDIKTNGFLNALPYLLQTAVGIIVSFTSDWIISKGYCTTNFVRKFTNSISGFGSALGLIAVCLAGCNVTLNVFFFMFSIAIVGFSYSGYALTLLDLSPEYSGTLSGIANSVASLTGFITPVVVGALINNQKTLRQWRFVFGITSGLLFIATFVFLFFSSSKKQDWNERASNKGKYTHLS